MKSKNKTYAILLTVIVAGLLFFFSTTLWMPDDRIRQNDNYAQTFTVGEWLLRVDNAKYNKTNNIINCRLLQRGNIAEPVAFDVTAYLGNPANKKVLPCTVMSLPDDPDTEVVKIKKVPNDYYYVSLVFTARSDFSTASQDSMDAFESSSTASSSSSEANGDIQTKTVKIDYRAAASANDKSSGQGD